MAVNKPIAPKKENTKGMDPAAAKYTEQRYASDYAKYAREMAALENKRTSDLQAKKLGIKNK
jgi:hypothetical protein